MASPQHGIDDEKLKRSLEQQLLEARAILSGLDESQTDEIVRQRDAIRRYIQALLDLEWGGEHEPD
jgi:hypothetical protein